MSVAEAKSTREVYIRVAVIAKIINPGIANIYIGGRYQRPVLSLEENHVRY
jgi:hypothetical protein